MCQNFLITCAFVVETCKNVLISCASTVQTCNWHVFTNTEIGFEIAAQEDTIRLLYNVEKLDNLCTLDLKINIFRRRDCFFAILFLILGACHHH